MTVTRQDGAVADDAPMKRRARVTAASDLPGVPAGTPGRVVMASGLEWIRYRVRFENGVELGSLDAKYLERQKGRAPNPPPGAGARPEVRSAAQADAAGA